MRHSGYATAILTVLALSGCVAPVGPVQVARFHVADVSTLGSGTIAIMPGPGMNPGSLEQQSYQTAVPPASAAQCGWAWRAPGAPMARRGRLACPLT